MGKSNIKLQLSLDTATAKKQMNDLQAYCKKNKLKLEVAKQNGLFNSVKGELGKLKGEAAAALKNVGGLGGALGNALGGAIGPLAIITTALTALKGIFDTLKEQSQSFGDKFTAVFAGVKGVVKNLMTNFDALGQILKNIGIMVITYIYTPFKTVFEAVKGLIDNGLTGAIEGAKKAVADSAKQMEEATNAISEGFQNVAENAGEAYKQAKRLAEVEDNVGTTTIEFEAHQKRLNSEIAKSKEVLSDETASIEEKEKALKRLMGLQLEYSGAAKKMIKAFKEQQEAILDTLQTNGQHIKTTKEQKKTILELIQTTGGIAKLASMGGVFEKVADALSDTTHQQLNTISSQISDIEERVANSGKSINKALKSGLKTDKEEAVIEIPKGSIKDIQNQISKLQEQQQLTIYGSIEFKDIQKQIDALQNLLKDKEVELSFNGQVLKLVNDATLKEAQTEIEEFAKWIETHFDSVEIKLLDEDDLDLLREEYELEKQITAARKQQIEEEQKQWQKTKENLEGIQSVYNAVSGAIGEVAGDSKEAAVAMQMLAIAEQVAAVASAIHNATKGDPYTIAARVIAAAGAVTGAILSSHSVSKKFATGGIVQGQFQTGDKQIIGVNAGEMVLTTQQQRNLFSLLKNGATGSTGNVVFKISGKDLVGVLNNQNSFNKLIQ